jgi:hypothetical protein
LRRAGLRLVVTCRRSTKEKKNLEELELTWWTQLKKTNFSQCLEKK